jgi:hypothetical protein
VSFDGVGIGVGVSRLVYETRVRLAVARSNNDVQRAFALDDDTPTVKKFGVVAGLGGALIVGASFALVGSATSASVPVGEASTPILAAIAPAAPVAPTIVEEPVDPLNGSELPPGMDPVYAAVDLTALPRPAFSLPQADADAPYLLMVDKTRKELFVLENGGESYNVVARYPASLGPKPGDKQTEGDLKTPEGLYRIVQIKEGAGLPAQYGPRAYVLNYPNEVDARLGKTGYGIWIHGSGIGAATDDTEGCVEINDYDIVALGRYVSGRTPVFIFPEGYRVAIDRGGVDKRLLTADTVYGLKEWRTVVAAN